MTDYLPQKASISNLKAETIKSRDIELKVFAKAAGSDSIYLMMKLEYYMILGISKYPISRFKSKKEKTLKYKLEVVINDIFESEEEEDRPGWVAKLGDSIETRNRLAHYIPKMLGSSSNTRAAQKKWKTSLEDFRIFVEEFSSHVLDMVKEVPPPPTEETSSPQTSSIFTEPPTQ